MIFKKASTILPTAFLIYFLSWFAVYKTNINTLSIQSEDAIPAMFLPISIIKEKTLYLDSYYNMMIQKYPHPDDKNYTRGLTPFYLKKIDNHYLSAFPIITALVSLPIYFFPLELGMDINWENIILLSKYPQWR